MALTMLIIGSFLLPWEETQIGYTNDGFELAKELLIFGILTMIFYKVTEINSITRDDNGH